MRITVQNNVDLSAQQQVKTKSPEVAESGSSQIIEPSNVKEGTKNVELDSEFSSEGNDKYNKQDLEQALEGINELLESTQKASKFVLHEGLGKYYVRLVNAETEEVIKEIPPEKLLNAFYEMQKLAGMIIDEKI